MKNYFQLDDDVIHLNHASVGPWPIATAEAVKAFAEENSRVGSKHYESWVRNETRLRTKLASLINAPSSDNIALLKSTSEGLSFIAYGLTWNEGDNIVIPAEEFPSNRIVWESLKDKGVEVRSVAVSQQISPEQALIDAFDDNTRLLSVSSVQYANGLRLDIEALGNACKQEKILYCVDAIQSLGALCFDVQAVKADFVVADGHKWMLGPEGLALFYCAEHVRDQLQLNEFGWHMVENLGDFDEKDWKPASTARRFECGSPNMTAVAALNASLDVLFDMGLEKIESLVLNNATFLFDALSAMDNIELLTPADASKRAGIITFRKTDIPTDVLYEYLQQQGVICALRGGGIRLSPHFHTSQQHLRKTLDLITNYAF
jgi:selenocysteine lyase/cysteine desulfurase